MTRERRWENRGEEVHQSLNSCILQESTTFISFHRPSYHPNYQN